MKDPEFHLEEYLLPGQPLHTQPLHTQSTLEENFNPKELIAKFKAEARLAVAKLKPENQKKYKKLLDERLAQLGLSFDEALKQYYENIKLHGEKSVLGLFSSSKAYIPKSELRTKLEKLNVDFQEFLGNDCQDLTS